MSGANLSTAIVDWRELFSNHKKAIADAIKAGHDDPTLAENREQVGCMLRFKMEDDRGIFCQFFNEYGKVDPNKLTESQVRKYEVDEQQVQVLKDSLLSCGKLFQPIITLRISDKSEKTLHGHHRLEAWKLAFPKKDIPRYVLDAEMLEELDDGSYVQADKVAYRRLRSTVAPNPPNKNLQYNMDDVANQLGQAVKLDPTLGGLKGASDAMTLDVLSDWMKIWHPVQYPNNNGGTHTKILNKYKEGDASTKVKKSNDENAIIGRLAKAGWDTEFKKPGEKKDKTWLDWYDSDRKVIMGKVGWREKNEPMTAKFMELISNWLVKDLNWESNSRYDKLREYQKEGCTEINLYIDIYTKRKGFTANLPSLKADRKQALEAVKNINEILYKAGVPFQVTQVLFPDQLTDKNDVAKVEKIARYSGKKASKLAAKNDIQKRSSTLREALLGLPEEPLYGTKEN
jgi:hypothetical protein